MQSNRVALLKSLWSLLTAAAPPAAVGMAWRTAERKVRQWDDVALASQPALFLVAGPQTAQKGERGITTWRCRAQVIIYWRNDSSPVPDVVPDDIAMQLIDWVDGILTPPAAVTTVPGVQSTAVTGKQTLGGACVNCYIEGTVAFDAGVVDNQGVLVIPITILAGN